MVIFQHGKVYVVSGSSALRHRITDLGILKIDLK
jgi:Fe2+ transport system protein FeoA